MIIAKIIGGLGNQMFQYAFASGAAERSGLPLFLDISDYRSYPDREFNLQYFELPAQIAPEPVVNAFLNRDSGSKRYLRLLKDKLAGRHYFRLDEAGFRFLESNLSPLKSNTYVDGYWQSYKYFNDREKEIREAFTFKKAVREKNAEKAKLFAGKNAVGLHIRRGDYVQKPEVGAVHGVCSPDYYRAAVKLISERIEEPFFCIFSDDPDWCRANLDTGFPQHIFDGNRPIDDLYLLSLCRHQIIANSSFSWWAAWLNNFPEKIVIRPEKWFAGRDENTSDLLPDSWITI